MLCRLFNSYCCSFYGSQIWRMNSMYYDNVCTSWNIGVRRVMNLPYTTHTWMLGPLIKQSHLRLQLQKRCMRFLHGITQSSNVIVRKCFYQAMQNSNTPIGCNLSFIGNLFEEIGMWNVAT